MKSKEEIDRIVTVMADEAEKSNADSNDENGVIRQIVIKHGLGFNAWFCVCCEIADRAARKEGFNNSIDKAISAVTRGRIERQNRTKDLLQKTMEYESIMDPTACLARIDAAMNEDDGFEEIREATTDLLAWLRSGGFLPTCSDRRGTFNRAQWAWYLGDIRSVAVKAERAINSLCLK